MVATGAVTEAPTRSAEEAPAAAQRTGASATGGERVTFESQGETIVGRLFPPGIGLGPVRAAVIIGPENYQKEQAPAQYALRLAQLGYTALIFDPRYRGESGGEPRCYENPIAKLEDLSAAFEFLSGRPDVDSERLALLGICFGGSYALRAAADDPASGSWRPPPPIPAIGSPTSTGWGVRTSWPSVWRVARRRSRSTRRRARSTTAHASTTAAPMSGRRGRWSGAGISSGQRAACGRTATRS
jgi:Dienelactone hydrolase family